jgi:cobalt-zinc-cadmium resistance protein CzcA
MDQLREIGERVAPILASIEGAEDVKVEQISGLSQLEIQQNRPAMARHKINAGDVNALIETAVGGQVATTVAEGQRRFDVLVRFPEDARNTPDRIGSLMVPSPAGYNVPLSELATIQEVQIPAQVSREDATRRVIVECNIRGRDAGSFVEEAQEKLAVVEDSLPTGYRLTLGGQFENQQRAMSKLKVLVPVAIFLIFLMLFASLSSVKSALLILANLPFAVIGGVVAIWLLDLNLSVSAAIGFIALLGVAVENGLLLVSFMDQLRAEGLGVQEAVEKACSLRIRALLMTTATTLLGLLPMVYATGSGSELQRPLVAVIFGGLVSSLVLTLIILPVLYVMLNGRAHGAPGKELS